MESDATAVVLEAFRAVEQGDEQALRDLYHPEIEFHWPPSLPYGGSSRGQEVFLPTGPTWGETWAPLRTGSQWRLDPRVVAASETEVVVLWRQRGVDAGGEEFDQPVLGLYAVRDGKFARAQMFYFDTVAVLDSSTARAAHRHSA